MNSKNHAGTGEKLQKVLARAGLGSRREMEKVISSGTVQVNNVTATLGDRVFEKDKITIDGQPINIKAAQDDIIRVILYNKPEGQICSQNDPEGRPTVFESLPKLASGRWISVGRLDFNTSGLLLFTNDGDLAHKLMHPSSNIDREYLVRVQGTITEEKIENLKKGISIDGSVVKFTDIVPGSQEGSNSWFYCVVMEGKNREVRRLWESQDCRVSRLKRVRYGSVFIPSHVRAGQWAELEESDFKKLYQSIGLVAPKQKFSAELKSFRQRQQKRLAASGASGSGAVKKGSKPVNRSRAQSVNDKNAKAPSRGRNKPTAVAKGRRTPTRSHPNKK